MTKLQIVWMYILRYTWYLPINIKNKLKKTPEKKETVKYNCTYLPERKTDGSVGYDLKVDIKTNFETWMAFETKQIPTGLKIEIPKGKCGLVFLRSSLALNSPFMLANGVGVIDSDYRGEIKLLIKNTSSRRCTLNKNDRIAQLVIIDCFTPELVKAKYLTETVRNEGGFGSTGWK